MRAPSRRSASTSGPTGRSRRRGTPSSRQRPGTTVRVATRKRSMVPALPQKTSTSPSGRPAGRQADLVLALLDREAAAAEGGQEQARVLGEERALDHHRRAREQRQVQVAVGHALRRRHPHAPPGRRPVGTAKGSVGGSIEIEDESVIAKLHSRREGIVVIHLVRHVGEDRAARADPLCRSPVPPRPRSASSGGGGAGRRGPGSPPLRAAAGWSPGSGCSRSRRRNRRSGSRRPPSRRARRGSGTNRRPSTSNGSRTSTRSSCGLPPPSWPGSKT